MESIFKERIIEKKAGQKIAGLVEDIDREINRRGLRSQ